MGKIKVLIADDHAIVRIGLRSVFGYEPDIAVVAEAKNGIEAVREAERTHPDVAVVDLVMPRKDGVAATREFRKVYPDARNPAGRRLCQSSSSSVCLRRSKFSSCM